MSDNRDELKDCIELFEVLQICISDKVEITMRNSRSIITYRGVVRALSSSAILLETRNGLVAIRLSEIKSAKKILQKGVS